jgi:hypothetical protein
VGPGSVKVRGAMQSTIRERFWFEAGVMSVCGILAVLTVIWPDWIEALTGFNPDNQIGSFEWMIVAGLFVVGVLAGFAACAELRRPRPAIAPGN